MPAEPCSKGQNAIAPRPHIHFLSVQQNNGYECGCVFNSDVSLPCSVAYAHFLLARHILLFGPNSRIRRRTDGRTDRPAELAGDVRTFYAARSDTSEVERGEEDDVAGGSEGGQPDSV